MTRRVGTAIPAGVLALLLGSTLVAVAAAALPAASASASSAPAVQASQVPLEQYHLLALSPTEGIAVLRGPDRRLVTLRVGTALPSARARLAQVLGDRLRFDTVDDKGERQTAWMIRPANPEQLPEVERVSGKMPLVPLASKGATSVIPLPASSAAKK